MKSWITFLLLFFANDTIACSVGFGDFSYLDTEASHIFSGTVIEIHTFSALRNYRFATVSVREVWRGDVPDTVVVATSSSSCGTYFRQDLEFVFFPCAPTSSDLDEWDSAGLDKKIWRGEDPLSVWVGSCATYELAGDATHINFGPPKYLANGLTSRTADIETLLDLLKDAETENTNEIISTLSLCNYFLVDDANSENPRRRALFERVVDTLLEVGLANRKKSEQVSAAAFYAVGSMGPAAEFALPRSLALYDETFATDFDVSYWMMLLRIGKNDPRLGAKLVEVAETSTVDETRAFALGQFWMGNVPWHEGAPQPDGFMADPAPNVRMIASRTLAQRTSDPDSLAFLAGFVLSDAEVKVITGALPTIIGRMEGDVAVQWIARGLTHPDSGVRWAAYGSKPLPQRDVHTRCAILNIALESPYEDVRKRAEGYWKRLKETCD